MQLLEGLCVKLLWVVNVHIDVFRTKHDFCVIYHFMLSLCVIDHCGNFYLSFSYYGELLLILCLCIISINFKIKLFLKGGLTKQQKSKKSTKQKGISQLPIQCFFLFFLFHQPHLSWFIGNTRYGMCKIFLFRISSTSEVKVLISEFEVSISFLLYSFILKQCSHFD